MFNKKRLAARPRLSSYRPYRLPLKRQSPFFIKVKKIFKIFLLLFIVSFSVYAFFFSNYFKVKNLIVVGDNFENKNLKEEIQKSIKSALNKNIFFLDTEKFEIKIINFLPELEKVKINKNYPSSLEIEFIQYPLVANVINESNVIKKTYIINAAGYAIKEDFENPNLPYIKIKSDEPINTKNPVIEKTKLNYILEAIKYFQDKFGMKISEAKFLPLARELHLLTEKNFSLWLDIQRSFEEQFKKLKKALVKLDIYKENFQYIDLRIAGNNGDKIIYKRR